MVLSRKKQVKMKTECNSLAVLLFVMIPVFISGLTLDEFRSLIDIINDAPLADHQTVHISVQHSEIAKEANRNVSSGRTGNKSDVSDFSRTKSDFKRLEENIARTKVTTNKDFSELDFEEDHEVILIIGFVVLMCVFIFVIVVSCSKCLSTKDSKKVVSVKENITEVFSVMPPNTQIWKEMQDVSDVRIA